MSLQLLPLKDNALFLQCYRERTRSAVLLSAVVIALIIISLVSINAYLNPAKAYSHTGTRNVVLPWTLSAFWGLAVLQGFLILLIGSLSANRMAVRERISGTLDFHRSSPTKRIDQILGLLLGAPVLEWIIFFGSMIFSMAFVLFSALPLMAALKFYMSLIVCALFYHSLAILSGIWNIRSAASTPRLGIVKFIGILFIFGFLAGLVSELPLSAIYHLSWLPFYQELDILITNPPPKHYSLRQFDPLHSFFALRMDTFVLLIFTQLPLLGLAWTGIARKISQPERPVLSKGQSSLFILFIMFLFIGSSISAVFYYEHQHYWRNPLINVATYFVILVLFLGITGSIISTPNRTLFIKGLRRAKKLGKKYVNPNEDHGTNVRWLMAVSFIFVVMFFSISQLLSCPISYKIISILVLLSYITFFASALEYFRLSKHYKKASFFFTGIAILWIFIPIFGFITDEIIKSPYYSHFFSAASPVFGIEPIISILNGKAGQLSYGISGDTFNILDFKLFVSLFVNGALAIVMSLLAARQRHKLIEEILKK